MNKSKLNKRLLIFLLGFLMCGISRAQNINSGEIKNENISTSGLGKQMERLNKLEMAFCSLDPGNPNTVKGLKIQLRPGQKQEICLGIVNFGTSDITAIIGFSKVDKDSHGKRVCDQDMGPNNQFSKLINGDFLNDQKNIETKIISGETQRRSKTYLTIPSNYSGDIRGCVTYKIKGDVSRGSGSLFDVVVRKTIPIKITITGDVYKGKRLDETKEKIKKNKYTIIKLIGGIIIIRLIVSIIQQTSKKKKRDHHKK